MSKYYIDIYTTDFPLGRPLISQYGAPKSACHTAQADECHTALAKPFSSRVPAERLFEPSPSARCLLGVIDDLTPTGGFFAWDGTPIEY
jgi:hypothetical protein